MYEVLVPGRVKGVCMGVQGFDGWFESTSEVVKVECEVVARFDIDSSKRMSDEAVRVSHSHMNVCRWKSGSE